ncbi:outer membrane beta-barrel protein [Brevundimonas sp. NIBR11]|uniref:outer membrane protein n=1 Tax=Brevundimonas sp. NIBR11 TaxID=3015999 RepID=UPI0022F10918|nr:outer membrane beta-barrel protein [Brevundimonas sp. NIBR11]WGM30333.1 hypothetical protein KKHFBJBL_00549 [Brevundimonas sp. NIBR11]
MMKTFAAVSAAALAVVAMPAAAQDWSGAYFGGFAGYQGLGEQEGETVRFDTNLDGTYGDTVRTTAAADAFSPGFCDGQPNDNNAAAGCEGDDDGNGEFGLRFGYDWQAGPIVFGVVGDAGTSSLEDRVTAFSTTPANYVFERETQYLLAARVRLGYAMGRYLPYVTGGYATARLENNFSSSNVANSFAPRTDETDATGYQIGGGIETKVSDRISLGVEYLYSDLEEDDPYIVRTGPGTAPATNPFLLVNSQGTDMRRSSENLELHSFRVTAAVRF